MCVFPKFPKVLNWYSIHYSQPLRGSQQGRNQTQPTWFSIIYNALASFLESSITNPTSVSPPVRKKTVFAVRAGGGAQNFTDWSTTNSFLFMPYIMLFISSQLPRIPFKAFPGAGFTKQPNNETKISSTLIGYFF